VGPGTRGTGEPGGWRLAWHDEFGGASCPDPRQWDFEHGFVRNVELQWYQRANASCRDGVLHIEARRSGRQNPDYSPRSKSWQRARSRIRFTSASLRSKSTFIYGRFEIRARIDARRGS
jgi:beta-glucanase (GH16 family)